MASRGGDIDTGRGPDAEERADNGGGGGGTVLDEAHAQRAQDANSTSAAPPPGSRAGVETIGDEEPAAPVPVMAAMLETTKGAAGEERRPAGVEHIEEADAGPPSFACAFDDGAPEKKVCPDHRRQVDEEETVVAPEECDDDLQATTVLPSPRCMNSRTRGHGVAVAAVAEGGDGCSSVDTIDFDAPGDAEDPEQADAPDTSVYTSGAENVRTLQGMAVPGITEAYAVDDTVIIASRAEPPIPLWKQTKVRVALALFFVAVAVLSIALGVILSREQPVVTQVVESESTLAPSISAYPTASPVPSASPSECSYTIGSSRQTINLLSPGADKVRTALDGLNLVVAYIVASRYSDSGKIDEGAFHIEFFKLQNSGTWERVLYSIERNVKWEMNSGGYVYFDIALSGKTTVIGLPSRDGMAGAVHVYRESVFGTWERVASPEATSRIGKGYSPNHIGSCRFGESVDIDDDLLVVADHHVCSLGPVSKGSNVAFVFKQVGDEWKEVDVLGEEVGWDDYEVYGQVVVKGNTIVCVREEWDQYLEVHTYDPQNMSVSHTQVLTPSHDHIKSLAISRNHLVFLAGPRFEEDWIAGDKSVFIYQREGVGKSYSLLQTLNSSDYDEGFGQAFALDGDMLVLGSSNQTQILSLQPSGRWEETLTLDQPYSHLQLSGRALVATSHENEVYSMDISDCTQPVPTQRPSISLAPSSSCHWVNVTFVITDYLDSWEAAIRTRELVESDSTNVATFNLPSMKGITPSNWSDRWWVDYVIDDQLWIQNSTCLQPGLYQFTLHGETNPSDAGHHSTIHYTAESNGMLIVREIAYINGSVAESDRVHPFDIPFVARGEPPTGAPLPPRPVPLTRPPSSATAPVSASPTIDINWPPPPSTAWPTPQPSAKAASGPSRKICLTRSECEEQMQSGGFVGFYAGSYADYGCFSKGENLYWGIGGAEEQMAASPLAGAKERVWCGQA